MIPTDPQDDLATATSDAVTAPGEAELNRPPDAPPAPEEETDEQWMHRFIEENAHLARPRPERPPAPPPSPWDGPPSTWKVPDHLSMRHPKGGYMAMALMSRTMDDLDEVTKGERAATYEEVDKYLGHALIAEGLVPFTYTADQAIRWWKSGGCKVLGSSPESVSGPSLAASAPATTSMTNDATPDDVSGAQGAITPESSADINFNGMPIDDGIDPAQANIRSTRSAGAPHLANAAFMVDHGGDASTRPSPAVHFTTKPTPFDAAAPVEDDGSIGGFTTGLTPIRINESAGARAAARRMRPAAKQADDRPAAPLGTNLSTYDTGFGGPGRGVNGDYRTTPEERAWLMEPKPLAGPDIAYPDGSPGAEQTSSKVRVEIRENAGYLYTLPEVKALLDVFARTEDTEDDGYYRTHYPNKEKLPDLTTFHGRVPIGRYQITKPNWENFGGNLWSRKDFSPTTQDLIAITQLAQKGAIDELLKGNLSGAFSIAARIFASIPMNSEKDYSYYSGGKGAPDAGPITNPPRQRTPVRFNDLLALFVQHFNARKKEFREAEQAWKTRKEIPQAFISPLRWHSFGLKGF
ncbi:hypothetical protein NDN01_24950 [Sphingomonas sp. QA11]|uniref:hypothetical protein n=1 Tax=Sphingomonas sp. QA11 TaxID=2950605 RepID=UPI00234A78A7|nr:hypothetical protein [Sphingomonas sp. QA11]WCM27192.1 hypothetical protein NDN01_24950 [Sphingomonas sp. QA11]